MDLSGVSFPLDLPTARALIQQMLGLRNGLMSLARDGLAYCDSSKQLTVDEYTAWYTNHMPHHNTHASLTRICAHAFSRPCLYLSLCSLLSLCVGRS